MCWEIPSESLEEGGARCRWNCPETAEPGRGERGAGLGAPSTPPPREAGSSARLPPPADRCLPWRPIRARLAGREAARGFYCGSAAARRCQDGLPVFQANGLAHPPRREEPRPATGPPPTRSFRANKMESRWSQGGARSLGRLAAELEHPSRPRQHAHWRPVALSGAHRLGGRGGRGTDAPALTSQPPGPGAAGGGAARGRKAASWRPNPVRRSLGPRNHPIGGCSQHAFPLSAPGSPWHDLRKRGCFWDLLPYRWGRDNGALIYGRPLGGRQAVLSIMAMGVTLFGPPGRDSGTRPGDSRLGCSLLLRQG